MNNEQVMNASPVPKLATSRDKTMLFGEALIEVTRGRKITRIDWSSNDEYGFLEKGQLMICTKGATHIWAVSDGDILATDWVLLPIQN